MRGSIAVWVRVFAALAALTVLGSAHAAKVYKSVDEQGNVTYSSTPPSPGRTAIEIKTRGSHISDDDAASKLKALTEESSSRRRNRELLEKSDEEAQAANERRRQNCETARKNLQVLQSANRVQAKDDSGQPFDLSPEVKQRKVEETKAQISEFCGA